jgi:6-phosphofructokinase 1
MEPAMSPAPIRRVGIVFSGGPAPAANAVISAAALRFIDDGIEVIGLLDGYRHLQDFRPDAPLREGEHFLRLTAELVSGIRTLKPILLRTSHADPSAGIACLDDLADPDRNRRILAVHDGLEALGVDALVSVGGDETLRTANHLLRIPDAVPGIPRVRVVHLPKTIDNDYFGIDWTFGFTSAVDFAAREIRNIGADAQSTSSWFVLELMGRQTGWLTYASGIAGEATKMISVEDIDGEFDVDTCGEELALLMEARARAGKPYGVVCVAEGLASRLPRAVGSEVDALGYSTFGAVNVGAQLAAAMERARERHGEPHARVRSKQIGYEARCAEPVAFDVMLGSQLGVGAHRALVTEGLDGVMVSVRAQLELVFVPFADLIDPATMRTRVRFIDRDSDFYRLARSLEYQTEEGH